MIKTLSKAQKMECEKFRIPRSVQDAIPIRRIFADGIFQVGNQYSKTWSFTDINYAIASKEDKTSMFLDYSELLNALDSGASAKITIYNRRINKAEFERSVLLPDKADGLDEYRHEFNKMLTAQVTGTSNSIVRERYLTVSVVKRNADEARSYFARVGTDLVTHLAQLSSVAQELTLTERLHIFRDFFKAGEQAAAEFNIHEHAKRGQHFKDWFCPDSMEFAADHFKVDARYGRVLYLQDYASYIKDSFVSELCDLDRDLMLSIDILPVPTDEAARQLQSTLLGVETNVANWQRRQNANNNFTATIPYDMELQRKETKEKPTAHMPRSNATGEIPKAALKKAWAEAKEKSRTMLRESTSTQGDGDYTTAQDTSSVVTDTSYSVIKQNTDFTVQQGRKIARKQIEKYRERRSAEQTETIRVHTANERGVSPKQVECSTLSDAERHPRRGADLPRQRAKEKVVTAKTAPRDIRGVTQGQRQLRTAANETVRSITTQAQMQTRTRQVQLAIQKAASSTCKTAVAVRSAIRHFLVGLHSLVAAIAAGISVALSIIIVISLVAFVSGSAYGIFFAANAPNADTITVQQAVETLTAEYRDRLEEISDTVQHDRQDITANDDVYYIRWQDVLAVFSSYVSGNEQGTPVAALTEEQVDKLRETMWAMNAVDCSTHPETTTIETTDEDGNPTTTEITETVLVIELTHKTPDEMAADYHFTTRQNTYLQLLQDPQYEELWAELLGGFAQGGGELMNPDSTRIPTGTLQWPLPVAGTITSQFGHRVDPITGEVSSHTGTDIACAEGTPILAAADGVVTVANGLDSWGGSYGYYIQIDHGGGLETLYAHCSSICVTTGQQVQAGQVIGYVGHTGRATGSHLHFEIHINKIRKDAMSYFGMQY